MVGANGGSVSTQLAIHATVCEAIRIYHAERLKVIAAITSLKTSQTVLDLTFKMAGASGVAIRTNSNRYGDVELFDLDYALKRMERDTWTFVIDRLDIWRVMSNERAGELRGWIADGVLPPLTEKSAFELARDYVGNLDSLLNELVKEVFDWLRPRFAEGHGYNGAEYVTNKHDIIGPKVIREFMLDLDDAKHGKYRVRDESAVQQLRTLEGVFVALDGKGVTGKGYFSELQNAIHVSKGTGQTEYFAFRCCKNGNLHIEFLRLDLLAELNRRAGGTNLKG
jgi:hypothetical protein